MINMKRRASGLAVLATTAALGLGTLGAVSASANPGTDPTKPGSNAGAGTIGITSATKLAKGQRLSFAGSGFTGSAGVFQRLSMKIDAYGPGTDPYAGSAVDAELGDNIIDQVQIQADGTVSGTVVVPDDIDLESANPDFFEGPHFLRFLGSAPGTSKYTQDFTIDAAAAPQATATATSAYAPRGGAFTVTVNADGFAAGEAVTVERATGWDTTTALTWNNTFGTANAEGKLVNNTVSAAYGVLPAGEHQLVLEGATSGKRATAQLTVAPRLSVAGIAQGSDGTLSVNNVPAGTEFSSIKIDDDGDLATTDDQVGISNGTFTVTDANADSTTVSVPASAPLGYGKTVVVTQTKPYGAVYTTTSKVSPSSAVLNADKYVRVESAEGAVAEGLYQSAYSRTNDVLFATVAGSASATDPDTSNWDGRLYKLDPNTLAVLGSVRPERIPLAPGGDPSAKRARFAPYGVGVDDTNGTVWVTNTRQNTVAVYKQSDLSLIKQFPAGTVQHARDVLHDPATNRIFVSSASEGSSGNGYISVFDGSDVGAADTNGDPFEKIEDVADLPRTTFSPMSLELDPESGTVYSVSLTTPRAIAIDTETLDYDLIELPGLTQVGNRGTSGVAFDEVTDRLFVVSQDNDLLLIANKDGSTVKAVPVGAGALNVAFDSVNRLVYVTNFGGTTISVTDVDGNLVANLAFTRPNHVHEDGKGSVFAVNKDSGNKVIKLTPKAQAATPVLRGTARVGGTLSTSVPAGGTVQWLRNGSAIAGATKASYALTSADLGRKVSVRLRVTAPGKAPASTTSAAVTVAAGVLSAPTPRISGTAKVKKTLKAKVGTWTPGTTLKIQWYANGKAIKGATKTKLKLTTKQRGKKITVKVTGKKAGYTTAVKKSKATAKVKR